MDGNYPHCGVKERSIDKASFISCSLTCFDVMLLKDAHFD